MGAAAGALATPQRDEVQQHEWSDRPSVRDDGSAPLARAAGREPVAVELVALQHGCMHIVAPTLPEVGQRVAAELRVADEPIGEVAGYVVGANRHRVVIVGLHTMSERVQELLDDLARLRASLRTEFVAELIEVRVRYA